MEQNSLRHYGVLGMKWGRRRSEAELAKARGSSKNEAAHDDYSKAHASKSVKSMSDKELRDRINRLQMERKYKQLTTKNIAAGQKFVQDVLVNAAKQTASSYVSKGMTKGVEFAINSILKKNKG